MKIMQFLHGNQLGGMEKFCIDLSNALSKEHQVIFLGDSVYKKYLDRNVTFVELDIGRYRNNILFLYKIFKIFKDFSPDIIHVHKQKSIQIMNRLEAFLDIPFVATKHDMQIKKSFYGLQYAISISQEIIKTIEAKYIFKIYNGIPYKEANLIQMPKTFNIVAVGGLREVKGYESLIESVSRLNFPFHLTIIGEGALRKTLLKQIKELDIEEKVSLVGFKSNIEDYLHSSDLQVISSKSEGFSLSMIEGIFYSKVLISTKVSGCMEILSNDLLYDIENLTEKINDVYENKNRYEKSFNKIKKTYKERLTIEVCAKEHLNVYEKIIKNHEIMNDKTYKIFKKLRVKNKIINKVKNDRQFHKRIKMKKDIRIKLLNRGSLANEESGFKKQSPKNEAKWGSCSFTFNPLEKDYDWLVIIDDIPKITPNRTEELSCPKENTILVTTEPTSITRYGRAFAKQFHYLITNQDEKVLPHPNAIRSQTGMLWFYGKDYDSITSVTHPNKTKKISTVCSNKQQGHTLHKLRYEFTKIMEERIPELERFGRGFRWIETKAEAIDDYEFHVAIENHYAPHVWTEKLADTFLGYAVPIYYGCPNVYEYFPKESLIQIDIHDVEGSIAKIKEVISTEGEYERRLDAVKEARRRVIEEYNLLAMINKIVENSKEDRSVVSDYKIYSRRIMRVRYLPDLVRFVFWKMNNFIKNIKFKG